MLKQLTYFNLLYGTCFFVLVLKANHISVETLVALAIVLLFNWLTLKEIEGLKLTTDRTLLILRVSTLIVAFVTIVNCLYLLFINSNREVGLSVLTILIFLRMVFVATISVHAVQSFKLNSQNKS